MKTMSLGCLKTTIFVSGSSDKQVLQNNRTIAQILTESDEKFSLTIGNHIE